MKKLLLQSFWSKPFLSDGKSMQDGRAIGGWKDRRFFFYSLSLSCLKALEAYGEVELYTDRLGKELLIDVLKLPYSKIHVVLNSIDHYPLDLWAIAKIYVYSVQKKPFIHIDNDIFIWKRFQRAFEDAVLVAQSIEFDQPYYYNILADIEQRFIFPTSLPGVSARGPIISSNAGILGGNNIEFFKEYSNIAFEFVERNMPFFKDVANLGLLNIVFEQLFFYKLAERYKIPIQYLFGNTQPANLDLVNFGRVPSKAHYIHPYGIVLKKDNRVMSCIETFLRMEYPNTYYRINYLLKEFAS